MNVASVYLLENSTISFFNYSCITIQISSNNHILIVLNVLCKPTFNGFNTADMWMQGKYYSNHSNTPPAMKRRIVNSFTTITSTMSTNVWRSFVKRVSLCLEQNGRHLEQLLYSRAFNSKLHSSQLNIFSGWRAIKKLHEISVGVNK